MASSVMTIVDLDGFTMRGTNAENGDRAEITISPIEHKPGVGHFVLVSAYEMVGMELGVIVPLNQLIANLRMLRGVMDAAASGPGEEALDDG